jgi:hypothetical protein
MASDASFYKPYPGSLGGTLQAGNASTLALPFRHTTATKKSTRSRARSR